jgi:hypothetical protein
MSLRALWGLLFDLWYCVSSCLLSSTKIIMSRCYQHRISSLLLSSLCVLSLFHVSLHFYYSPSALLWLSLFCISFSHLLFSSYRLMLCIV